MNQFSLTHFASFLLVLGLVAVSCQKDIATVDPIDPTVVENIPEHLEFFESETEESDRVTMVNEMIVLNDTSLERSACTKYSAWAKIAEVASFPDDTHTLSATHVARINDLAIVSYHVRGAGYLGVVEIWDMKDANNLKYKGYVRFLDADVNSVVMEKSPSGNTRRVWVALASKKKGAVVAELKMGSNNKFDNNHLRFSQLTRAAEGVSSASANAIVETENHLYVTAGQSVGGVFTLNKTTLEVVGSKSFSDAKGVAVNGTAAGADVAAVKTNNGAGVFLEKVGKSNFDQFFPIEEITHQNVESETTGKITTAFAKPGSPYLFIASGDEGLKGYDINNGSLVYQTPEKFLQFGNANGISLDDDYLYVANGADGVAICPLAGHLPDESSVFLWDMDEPTASANFISSEGNWIVIAKGEKGFKLLKKATPDDCLPICSYNNEGLPACLINDEPVCPTLQLRIATAMPIIGNLQILQPLLFQQGAKEILLTKDTEVKLTFLEENTNWENSLGFYFYHKDCPPASKADLIGMVAFANFSALGSNGELVSGNTVTLPGTFKEGTHIGFFLIRKGFTGGHDIYYSKNTYNPANKHQGLLFHDQECGGLIGAFEDLPAPSAHGNFRDAIFKITTTVPDAFNPSDYLRL